MGVSSSNSGSLDQVGRVVEGLEARVKLELVCAVNHERLQERQLAHLFQDLITCLGSSQNNTTGATSTTALSYHQDQLRVASCCLCDDCC